MESGHYGSNKKPVSPHNSPRLEYSTVSWESRRSAVREWGAAQFTGHWVRFRPFLIHFLCQKQKKRVLVSEMTKRRSVGWGEGGFREWWGRWRGWKMCCWRRQHPRCQSKQGWAEGPQVCSLLAWLQTGCSTDSPKRLALHTIQLCALQDSFSLSLSFFLADWPPASTWIVKSEVGKKQNGKSLFWGSTHWQWHITTQRKNVRGLFLETLKCLRRVNIMSVLYHLLPNSEIGHNMLLSHTLTPKLSVSDFCP